MKRLAWVSTSGVFALLLATGCEDLECDPTFVESMGTCVCPTGQIPVDDGTGRRCEACPAGSMPVGETCVATGDGGMDSGGDTGGDPCGGTCEGEMPFCDTESGSCVQCLEASHCDADAPVCGADGMCAACTAMSDCSAYPDTPLCNDGGDGACVACVGHGDCPDAAAAQCDPGSNTCVPCDDSVQCTEAGEGVCDESGASGVCVECNADDESACGTDVCHVEAMTCTDTPAGDTGLCSPCVSDRQCMDGQVCAPMDYRDADTPLTDLGHFCLWREDASVGGGPDGSCTRVPPYAQAEDVTTLSGASSRVCSLAVSTCAALQDFRAMDCDTPFDSDADCGEGLGDGLCRMFDDVVNRCTTRCSSSDDCEPGHACEPGTPRFCSLTVE